MVIEQHSPYGSTWEADTRFPDKKHVKKVVLHLHIIAATFDRDTQLLEVSYLDRRNEKALLSLVTVTGVVQCSENDFVSTWIETLMHNSYEGTRALLHSCLLYQTVIRFWCQSESTIKSSSKPIQRACTSDIVSSFFMRLKYFREKVQLSIPGRLNPYSRLLGATWMLFVKIGEHTSNSSHDVISRMPSSA